jgi:hypothetical protein
LPSRRALLHSVENKLFRRAAFKDDDLAALTLNTGAPAPAKT